MAKKSIRNNRFGKKGFLGFDKISSVAIVVFALLVIVVVLGPILKDKLFGVFDFVETPEKLMAKSENYLFKKGDLEKAEVGFKTFEKKYPYDQAMYERARYLAVSTNFQQIEKNEQMNCSDFIEKYKGEEDKSDKVKNDMERYNYVESTTISILCKLDSNERENDLTLTVDQLRHLEEMAVKCGFEIRCMSLLNDGIFTKRMMQFDIDYMKSKGQYINQFIYDAPEEKFSLVQDKFQFVISDDVEKNCVEYSPAACPECSDTCVAYDYKSKVDCNDMYQMNMLFRYTLCMKEDISMDNLMYKCQKVFSGIYSAEDEDRLVQEAKYANSYLQSIRSKLIEQGMKEVKDEEYNGLISKLVQTGKLEKYKKYTSLGADGQDKIMRFVVQDAEDEYREGMYEIIIANDKEVVDQIKGLFSASTGALPYSLKGQIYLGAMGEKIYSVDGVMPSIDSKEYTANKDKLIFIEYPEGHMFKVLRNGEDVRFTRTPSFTCGRQFPFYNLFSLEFHTDSEDDFDVLAAKKRFVNAFLDDEYGDELLKDAEYSCVEKDNNYNIRRCPNYITNNLWRFTSCEYAKYKNKLSVDCKAKMNDDPITFNDFIDNYNTLGLNNWIESVTAPIANLNARYRYEYGARAVTDEGYINNIREVYSSITQGVNVDYIVKETNDFTFIMADNGNVYQDESRPGYYAGILYMMPSFTDIGVMMGSGINYKFTGKEYVLFDDNRIYSIEKVQMKDATGNFVEMSLAATGYNDYLLYIIVPGDRYMDQFVKGTVNRADTLMFIIDSKKVYYSYKDKKLSGSLMPETDIERIISQKLSSLKNEVKYEVGIAPNNKEYTIPSLVSDPEPYYLTVGNSALVSLLFGNDEKNYGATDLVKNMDVLIFNRYKAAKDEVKAIKAAGDAKNLEEYYKTKGTPEYQSVMTGYSAAYLSSAKVYSAYISIITEAGLTENPQKFDDNVINQFTSSPVIFKEGVEFNDLPNQITGAFVTETGVTIYTAAVYFEEFWWMKPLVESEEILALPTKLATARTVATYVARAGYVAIIGYELYKIWDVYSGNYEERLNAADQINRLLGQMINLHDGAAKMNDYIMRAAKQSDKSMTSGMTEVEYRAARRKIYEANSVMRDMYIQMKYNPYFSNAQKKYHLLDKLNAAIESSNAAILSLNYAYQYEQFMIEKQKAGAFTR